MKKYCCFQFSCIYSCEINAAQIWQELFRTNCGPNIRLFTIDPNFHDLVGFWTQFSRNSQRPLIGQCWFQGLLQGQGWTRSRPQAWIVFCTPWKLKVNDNMITLKSMFPHRFICVSENHSTNHTATNESKTVSDYGNPWENVNITAAVDILSFLWFHISPISLFW